jgi:hypothetical protein
VSDIYQVGHLERVPLGTLYPGIVAHVRRLLGKLPNAALIIDYTGVGRPVFDLFTSAGISPVGVLITGGAVETHDGPIYGVPKLTLVSRLQALLHEGRLKIHKELSEAETLVRELQDFRVEFTAAGHLTFNARSGRHDDLVLALAIAVWHAHGGMAGAGEFELTRQRAAALGVPSALGPRYFVGVDLGQSRDPTAIAVVRRVGLTDPAAAAEPGRKPEPVYAPGSLEWQRQQAEREGRLPATGETAFRRELHDEAISG